MDPSSIRKLSAEAREDAGHARDMANYLAGGLLERPNFNATRLLEKLADTTDALANLLDRLTDEERTYRAIRAVHAARFAHPEHPRTPTEPDRGDMEYAGRMVSACLNALLAEDRP